MKYLEHLGLESISRAMSGTDLGGGRELHGRVEIYSTKRAKEDKKHSKLLENRLAAGDQSSASFPVAADQNAPVHVFQQCAVFGDTSPQEVNSKHNSGTGSPRDSPEKTLKKTRKMLVDLIQTLNAAQQDHDFSELSPDSFEIVTLEEARQVVNTYLADLAVQKPHFLSSIWKEIDDALSNTLSQCEIYRLTDLSYADDLDDGITSAFHYFFCNKELKRLCYFNCHTTCRYRRYRKYSATVAESELEDDEDGMEMDDSLIRGADDDEEDDDDAQYDYN